MRDEDMTGACWVSNGRELRSSVLVIIVIEYGMKVGHALFGRGL